MPVCWMKIHAPYIVPSRRVPLILSSYSTVSGTIAPGSRKIPAKQVPRSAMKGNSIHGCPEGMSNDRRKQAAPLPNATMHACRLPQREPFLAQIAVVRIAANEPVGYKNPIDAAG